MGYPYPVKMGHTRNVVPFCFFIKIKSINGTADAGAAACDLKAHVCIQVCGKTVLGTINAEQ